MKKPRPIRLFCGEESLEKPKYLFIEGDGVLMKGQPKGSVEMHRFQVATE